MSESLTVKIVAELTGLTIHTLRAWERRYKAVVPKRHKSGRRLYDLSDVQKLNLLSEMQTQGHSIGIIAKLSIQELLKLQKNTSDMNIPLVSSPTHIHKADEDIEKCIEQILNALEAYKLEQVDLLLAQARMNFSVRQLIFTVFGQLMNKVGTMVEDKTLGISQEHALSAILRNHLVQILQGMNHPKTKNIRAIFSTQEGDLHEFGILMSAILCSSFGITTHYLGPNIPAQDFAEAAQKTKSQLVIVGSSPLPVGTTKVSQKIYLKQLTEKLKSGVEIFLGGEKTFDLEKSELKNKVRYIPTLNKLDEILSSLILKPY